MKLNNTQIKALASKISQEIAAVHNAKNKEIDNEIAKTVNRIVAKNELFKTMLNSKIMNNAIIISFLKTQFPDKFAHIEEKTIYNSYHSENKIKDEIVLQTIETDDVQELINNVKNKFI